MKSKVKSIVSKVWGWLLAVLGVGSAALSTSCCAMYACPYSDFLLKGAVTDMDSNPIPGIKVTLQYKPVEENEPGVPAMEGAFSDEKGIIRYHDSYSMVRDSDEIYCIKIEDVDGPENGGEFVSKTIPATIVKTKKGDDGWFMGNYECTFKAALEKVEPEVE